MYHCGWCGASAGAAGAHLLKRSEYCCIMYHSGWCSASAGAAGHYILRLSDDVAVPPTSFLVGCITTAVASAVWWRLYRFHWAMADSGKR